MLLYLSGPHRVTENCNCVILNGAKRSEESWFYAGWEARFFPIWVRITILNHPAQTRQENVSFPPGQGPGGHKDVSSCWQNNCRMIGEKV